MKKRLQLALTLALAGLSVSGTAGAQIYPYTQTKVTKVSDTVLSSGAVHWHDCSWRIEKYVYTSTNVMGSLVSSTGAITQGSKVNLFQTPPPCPAPAY